MKSIKSLLMATSCMALLGCFVSERSEATLTLDQMNDLKSQSTVTSFNEQTARTATSTEYANFFTDTVGATNNFVRDAQAYDGNQLISTVGGGNMSGQLTTLSLTETTQSAIERNLLTAVLRRVKYGLRNTDGLSDQGNAAVAFSETNTFVQVNQTGLAADVPPLALTADRTAKVTSITNTETDGLLELAQALFDPQQVRLFYDGN